MLLCSQIGMGIDPFEQWRTQGRERWEISPPEREKKKRKKGEKEGKRKK